jgi:transcriptional regulator with XRE-family HTH domain
VYIQTICDFGRLGRMPSQKTSKAFREQLEAALDDAKRRGLSNREVATRSGVCANTICNWKRGTSPRQAELIAVCKTLEIPVAQLIDGGAKGAGHQAPSPQSATNELAKYLNNPELINALQKLREAQPHMQQLAAAIPDLMDALSEAQRQAQRSQRREG